MRVRTSVFCTFLCLLSLYPTTTRASPVELVFSFDCDAGDDPARLLQPRSGRGLRPAGPRPIVIELTGSCRGPLRIARDHVTLRGGSEGAILEGEGTLIDVHGARGIVLENLELRGAETAIRAQYAGLTVRECEIASSTTGLRSITSETLVERSRFRETTFAVGVESAGSAELRDSVIERSSYGIFTFGASVVVVRGGTIDAFSYGVAAGIGSAVTLADGLSIGTAGIGALLATQDGEVSLFDVTTGANAWVTIERNGTVYTSSETRIDGNVELREGGELQSSGSSLGADVFVNDLSRALFRGGRIAGRLVCNFGGDALCPQIEVTEVTGCGSCAPAGSARRPDAPRRNDAPARIAPSPGAFESIRRAYGPSLGPARAP